MLFPYSKIKKLYLQVSPFWSVGYFVWSTKLLFRSKFAVSFESLESSSSRTVSGANEFQKYIEKKKILKVKMHIICMMNINNIHKYTQKN